MNDEQPPTHRSTGVFVKCLIALVVNAVACTVVTTAGVAIDSALNPGSYGGLAGLIIGLNGLAVYQLAYLWPWWRAETRRGRRDAALGIKIAAGLTALVVGVCWTAVTL
jgi:hypothetical protein